MKTNNNEHNMSVTRSDYSNGNGIRITINGRFEFSCHQAFRETYADVDPKNISFIIDLTNASYIDSAALGMLLVLRERAGGMKSDITLVGFNHSIKQILEISHFHDLFKLEGSLET
jgi:anti-anti-sigma factor